MIVLRLTYSSKAAKGEQEQGSRGDQQGHRAVVAFHPKGFRCACGKENGVPTLVKAEIKLARYIDAKIKFNTALN